MPQPAKSQSDAPPIVMWELTRACRVQCMHCTVAAQARRSPLELSTYEAYKTIDQIVALRPREVIITGGDPLERADAFQLLDYARRRGLRSTVTVSMSPHLTGAAFGKLRANGVDRVAIAIDGSNPERHDSVRGVHGHFATTLQGIRWARTAGLAVEIDTLVTRRSARDLETIADLAASLGAVRWNLSFLVQIKRAREIEMLTSDEVETLFGRIFEMSSRLPFPIRTFEAPHYARYLLQTTLRNRQETLDRYFDAVAGELEPGMKRDFIEAAAAEVLFISHTGEVSVSPFAPTAAGNVRYQPLSTVYRGSELFAALRDNNNLHGKCGRCEYRAICRGSRARAFATTGDIFAADPLCAYQPGAFGPPVAVGRSRDADTGV